MRYGIGIDTGGTYTDAVVYDFETKQVLDYAKALTTRDDLSIGIIAALDNLDPALVRKAEMISLSTTLATNACVENRGGRAKLLFIGVDRKIVDWVGAENGLKDPDQIRYIAPEDGTLNWASFLEENRHWLADADALGIVQIGALDNSAAFEKEAREVIDKACGVPVICGYELFCDLNAVKRGSSVLLNGRLVPVLAEFLAAIRKALAERGITAPVAIVRSDGSLMSERFTGVRPVETILCGPAASVVGANALMHEQEAVIVDMGGTTTDIALIRGGQPVSAKGGVAIGNWRTFVKGVYVETIGLGGDSAVRFDWSGQYHLEATRVIPLSVAADRWPQIVPGLRALLSTKGKHTLLLHEFFVRVKDIGGSARYTEEEKRFCSKLGDGPLIYTDAAKAAGRDPYSLTTSRLEREGIIMRCGLTPTDIMHIKGDFARFNAEAAQLGAQFVANSLGMGVEALCELVYEDIKKRLYGQIVRMLIRENMPELQSDGVGDEMAAFIGRSWEMFRSSHAEHMNFRFETDSVLIGVGAPVHIFLPDVARALGTRCEIPRLAGVVNAVGAVAGNIMAASVVRIRPNGDEGFRVFGANLNRTVKTLEEATAAAFSEAEQEARAEALGRGAVGEIMVSVGEKPVVVQTAYGDDFFVESEVVATAIGKIGL